jgi:hypothetical protein
MSEYSSDKILQAKSRLDAELAVFISNYPKEKKDKVAVQKLVTKLITEYSNVLSTTNIAIGKTHQENDFFLCRDLQLDYLTTIENCVPAILGVIETVNQIIEKHQLTKYSVNEKSFETIQRFVNTFGTAEVKKSIKEEFKKRNLSIKGFNKKFKRMKNKYLRTQLFVGIPILIVCVLIIFTGELFLGKAFNGIQLVILKALISLSVSIIGSSLIEGNVHTNWTLQKGLTIRAVGWVAVFLLLYFVNPASPGNVH